MYSRQLIWQINMFFKTNTLYLLGIFHRDSLARFDGFIQTHFSCWLERRKNFVYWFSLGKQNFRFLLQLNFETKNPEFSNAKLKFRGKVNNLRQADRRLSVPNVIFCSQPIFLWVLALSFQHEYLHSCLTATNCKLFSPTHPAADVAATVTDVLACLWNSFTLFHSWPGSAAVAFASFYFIFLAVRIICCRRCCRRCSGIWRGKNWKKLKTSWSLFIKRFWLLSLKGNIP